LSVAAFAQKTVSQTVTFDHPGALYVSPSGQGAYRRVGEQSPATFQVAEGEYDLLVEGPADFFHIWHGEQPKVYIPNSSASISIPMRKELAWSRVVLVGLGGGAVLLGLLFLRLRKVETRSATLEGQLEEEKAYAELRPGALPKKVGRFTVIERLGTGGMATVYQVRDEYGDVYALKVPDVRVLDHENTAARFFREMEIGQSLHHPGIVRIHEVHKGDEGTHPYIAQELIQGETLRGRIDREAPLDERIAVAITRDLLDALGYAHAHGVIHRDIKPANVMITHKGGLRIMDFGIAKATKLETMTGTDTTLGTPDYMAPEQVDGRAASVQSDLYSVGVVLFEMLTGRLPFIETDAYKLLVRKMRENAPRVSEFRADVGKRLDNLVALLLSPDPTRRPTSAEELRRMLELLE
jgi:hypothetical protein